MINSGDYSKINKFDEKYNFVPNNNYIDTY